MFLLGQSNRISTLSPPARPTSRAVPARIPRPDTPTCHARASLCMETEHHCGCWHHILVVIQVPSVSLNLHPAEVMMVQVDDRQIGARARPEEIVIATPAMGMPMEGVDHPLLDRLETTRCHTRSRSPHVSPLKCALHQVWSGSDEHVVFDPKLESVIYRQPSGSVHSVSHEPNACGRCARPAPFFIHIDAGDILIFNHVANGR